MADTQSHTPGVIRCTQDYLQAPDSLAPDSLAPESLAPDSRAPESLASESSPAPESPEDSEDARVPSPISTLSGDDDSSTVSTTRESPREVRNRAEKIRRDRLNKSVAELASMVPPVVAARRKIDKTTVLRLTAHYLRTHQHVFGDSIGQSAQRFSPASILKALSLLNGFLITTTYRGIIVVVSQNVNQYLGYSELDLLGQNLYTITHEGDQTMLREQLMPRTQNLGPNGELIMPDEPDATRKVKEALAHEKRRFIIRLKKLGQRSEPSQYVTCHMEGSLRKSDRACRGYNRCCQIVRRARARSENPCSSGNDIVFIGMVRPTSESFINESALESYRMEYRTRHSIDGEIIQCESRIALVTGYMTHEVSGVNAMNFMHRDDVRWVIIALREMYDQHRVFGESCYRLITKNGQLIYMRTRGCLDVNRESRAVTSFMCTNTVVNEEEGKQLIKLMKRKFTLLVNNDEGPTIQEIEDDTQNEAQQNEDEPAPVEDPKRLEQVILHLVTNLPSPSPQDSEDEPFAAASPERKSMSPRRLTIIPPNKERIVSAIEKIYGIKTFPRDPNHEGNNNKQSSTAGSSHTKPLYIHPVEMNCIPAPREAEMVRQEEHRVRQEAQIVPYQSAHVSSYVQAPDSSLAPPMADNYSDTDNNSDEILNTVTSPDMGYFDISQSPFSNLSSIFTNFNQKAEEMFNVHQVADMNEFEYPDKETVMNMPKPKYEEESNVYQTLPQASSNNFFLCGTKRPNVFEDFDMVYKKKITDTEFFRQNEPSSDLEFVRQNEPTADLELVRQNEPVADLEFVRQNEPTADLQFVRQNEPVADLEFVRQDEPTADLDLVRQNKPTSDLKLVRKNESTADLDLVRQNEPTSDLEFVRQNEPTLDLVFVRQNEPTSDLDFVQPNGPTSELEFSRQNEAPSDLELARQNESSLDESLLDFFSDESIFDGDQIELAVNTMAYIDPTLPNLLRTDVKEVLEQIEKEADQEQRLREFDLTDYE